mmetsp:Transcript_21007/g.60737  ORF Transcript_21007/g.60737 Transcript_21007/m.60737 type:complete len:240 (+) Transcript_21007:288-1007(+)
MRLRRAFGGRHLEAVGIAPEVCGATEQPCRVSGDGHRYRLGVQGEVGGHGQDDGLLPGDARAGGGALRRHPRRAQPEAGEGRDAAELSEGRRGGGVPRISWRRCIPHSVDNLGQRHPGSGSGSSIVLRGRRLGVPTTPEVLRWYDASVANFGAQFACRVARSFTGAGGELIGSLTSVAAAPVALRDRFVSARLSAQLAQAEHGSGPRAVELHLSHMAARRSSIPARAGGVLPGRRPRNL